MTNWQQVKLGEVSDSIHYGHTASASPDPVGPKFLRITDIQNGAVDWKTVPYCLSDKTSEVASALKTGDIVFARTGATTGKSFLITQCPDRAVFASYLIRVRTNSKVIPGYLAHFFRTPNYWSQIALSSRGAAQGGVNATILRTLSLPLPPLESQRKIASILNDVEELRVKRRQAIAKLDALTQSLFLDLFGDPATNARGWQISRVGDVADVQGGLQVTTARKNLPREVPYLRVANVYRGFLNLSEIKTIRATDAEIARTKLVDGDLLIVEGHGNPAEIGRGALWDGSITDCIHQNHIIRARFARAKVIPLYACEYLNSPGGRRHLLRAGKTTSGLNTISVTEVRGTPIALPPIELQRKFDRQVSAVEKLKMSQRASLAKLDAFFATLQHRAFRGELN